MSENNSTNIKVGFSLDSNSLSKTSQQIQQELNAMAQKTTARYDVMLKNLVTNLEKYQVKIENTLGDTSVVGAAKNGLFKNDDSAKSAYIGFLDKYLKPLQAAVKKAHAEEMVDEDEISAKKIRDYLSYTKWKADIDKQLIKEQDRDEQDVIKKQKEQKKELDKEESERVKKRDAEELAAKKRDEEVLAAAQKKLKERNKEIAKEKREEEKRVREEKRQTYKFYSNLGGGVGGMIGGSSGALIGRATGNMVGEIATGGNVIGGALGLAIEALTAAVMHLSKVMDRDAEIGYNAATLGTTANKLNAFQASAKVFGLKEKDVMPGLITVGKSMAALNLRDNGTFSASTPEALKFRTMTEILGVKLTDKNGIRDSVDVLHDILHSKKLNRLGITKRAQAYHLAQLTGLDYLTVDRLIDPKYQAEENANIQNNPLTDRNVAQGQSKIANAGRLENTTDSILHTDTDIAGSKYDKIKGWLTGLKGKIPNWGRTFKSAEDALLSPEAKYNQMRVESGGKSDAEGEPFETKNGIDQAFGAFQISLNTANLPRVLKAFNRKSISKEDLKDLKFNEQIHDWLMKDNIKNLVTSHPELKNNQVELARQALFMYNHSPEALKKYQQTGYMPDSYADKVLVNIHIDARGNPNAHEIAHKTKDAVQQGVNRVVMNNQPSTRG
jgi:hypothetical protein